MSLTKVSLKNSSHFLCVDWTDQEKQSKAAKLISEKIAASTQLFSDTQNTPFTTTTEEDIEVLTQIRPIRTLFDCSPTLQTLYE